MYFFHAGKKEFVSDNIFNENRIIVFDNGFPRPIVEEEIKELHLSRRDINFFNIKYLKSNKKIPVHSKKKTQRKNQTNKNNIRKNCKKPFRRS